MKFISLVAFSSMLTVLVSCTTPAAEQPTRNGLPYKLSNEETAAVFDGVRRELKDPYTSVISTIVATRNARGVVSACGYVNSKNSYGAFTGDSPFIGALGKDARGNIVFVATAVGETPTARLATLRNCRLDGIAI